MPLWYSSIAEEHRAVRERAGLFDCTHMGVLEVSGAEAAEFLNIVTTNEVPSLKLGRARYGYILDAAGNVLDDIIIYRRSETNFMVVVTRQRAQDPFYLRTRKAGRQWTRRNPRGPATLPRLQVAVGICATLSGQGPAGGHCPAGPGVDGHPCETDGRCRGCGADLCLERFCLR
jgi:glycine cleavage system aminomethyltransferase T